MENTKLLVCSDWLQAKILQFAEVWINLVVFNHICIDARITVWTSIFIVGDKLFTFGIFVDFKHQFNQDIQAAKSLGVNVFRGTRDYNFGIIPTE